MNKESDKTRLLVILTAVLVFNKIEHPALGLFLQSIKLDLQLSDTQLGLLSGIAFTLFYSVMGLPIARWADRGNRVIIISISTLLQCAAVALCGTAMTFTQLLLIRVCVGVGEAGCIPPAHSLIGDYFSRSERPRAVARYMLGYPLSTLVGYFVAGSLNEIYGWRRTFVILGMPGVALAAWTWLRLSEPRQAQSGMLPCLKDTAPPEAHATFQEVLSTLFRNATFRHLLLSYSLISFFGVGIFLWAPAFFIRSFGLSTQVLGILFGLIYGLGGLIGTYLGGELASRYAVNNERLQLVAISLTYFVLTVISAAMYISHNIYVALVLLSITNVGMYATVGPLFATVQTLVLPRMRAVAFATLYLFSSLIGAGIGPLAAGALSDALRSRLGGNSLRIALLVQCPGYAWAGWHCWRASRAIVRDIGVAQSSAVVENRKNGEVSGYSLPEDGSRG